MDTMPAEILKHTGLEETRQALKQFARLPREAKVRELLLAMQSAADSAMARHCLNAEAANKNGIKEDAKASEDDARTAAFTTWTQFAVQAFCAEVDTTKQGVGANEGGKFPKATLVALAAKIPAAVVLCYPALMETIKAVEEHGDDMVANTQARNALALLGGCGADADGFWQMQSGGGTGRSSSKA